jgi:hypothetical protein
MGGLFNVHLESCRSMKQLLMAAGLLLLSVEPSVAQDKALDQQQAGPQAITTGTANIRPSKRVLADPQWAELKKQLLIFSKDKHISIVAISGDVESQDFAEQIREFLKENGFEVDSGVSEAVFNPAPQGLVVRNKADGSLELIIGPSK